MKLTEIGTDIISVDEKNYRDWCDKKIHIIKLKFKEPTKEKVEQVFINYKKTNRFIIQDNIRLYNYIMKYINKKYYIENTKEDRIISFFKRNNKVVLNMFNLNEHETTSMYDESFLLDILNNLEVMIVDTTFYHRMKYILESWSGNIIISNGDNI